MLKAALKAAQEKQQDQTHQAVVDAFKKRTDKENKQKWKNRINKRMSRSNPSIGSRRSPSRSGPHTRSHH